ncbi:MAG: hypothetical protein ACRELG_11420, partial [Gemmataceae bacterium]
LDFPVTRHAGSVPPQPCGTDSQVLGTHLSPIKTRHKARLFAQPRELLFRRSILGQVVNALGTPIRGG